MRDHIREMLAVSPAFMDREAKETYTKFRFAIMWLHWWLWMYAD